jgi:hypothetical protein
VGGLWLVQKEMGHWKIKNYNFSFIFNQKKPNHPNTIGVMFHPKIRNPN